MRKKIADSLETAQLLIKDRQITVNGALADKARTQVLPGDAIERLPPPAKYVGRGGLKLEAALKAFKVDPSGKTAIDIGSSTGGFTDALLQTGAQHVVALDVGTAQLHEKLRSNPKVTVQEQTDIRSADIAALNGPFDLVVVDVSFIGLAQIVTAIVKCSKPDTNVISLIKPQFEASKAEVSKTKGVVKDSAIWQRVLKETHQIFESAGLNVGAVCVSPIRGGSGNVEFFFHAGPSLVSCADIDKEIEVCVSDAQRL